MKDPERINTCVITTLGMQMSDWTTFTQGSGTPTLGTLGAVKPASDWTVGGNCTYVFLHRIRVSTALPQHRWKDLYR